MKTKRQHVQRHILTSLSLMLTLLLVAPGVTPAATAGGVTPVRDMTRFDQPNAAGTVPAGLTAGDQATMRDLIREAEYQFIWQVSGGVWAYRAPNRAHDLSLSLAADGFHAARTSAAGEPLWDVSLSLVAYGEQAVPAAIAGDGLNGSRERVEYHWSRDVVEWYVNRADGIEHGVTLAAPPAGAGDSTVELTFALGGSLTPELDPSGRGLRLKDASSQTALFYDQLAVYDATGRSLPSHMRLTEGRQTAELQLVIDTAGAAYPLIVDPLLHGEVAKLTASDAEDEDLFGFSVAISGDTVVAGAPWEGGAGYKRGAAYVFERNQDGADSWGQVTKLTASDAEDEDLFGDSVAISGDTIVVGAYLDDGAGTHRGAAYVFERNRGGADNWGQVTKLTASDAEDNDVFGTSVAISGDTVAVGAWSEDGEGAERGAAYLFARNEGGADSWGQVAKLTASDAEDGDRFGRSVAINGNTVVAGAFWEDGMGNNRGAAYLFVAAGGQWQEVAIPRAYDAEDEDYLGFAVAISGDTVVVGAYQEDGAGSDRGAAYLIERNQEGADNWGQVKKLTAMDGQDDDYFGYSVAISGDTVVVGAYGEDGGGTNQGAAYIFARNHNPADPSTPLADYWGQVKKLTALVPGNSHWFGYSVAISGDTVVVGAPGTNEGGNLRGAAYVFARNQGGMDNWGLVEKLTASDAADGDYFGRSVAISEDTVVVGAIYEDGAGSARGAAYIFARNEGGADNWGQVRKLTASDAEDNDFFGRSVAISGDILVVGADGEDGAGSDRGAAYLFSRNQGGMDNWGQVRKLTASDAEDDDYFGISVSISGDTLVVGAHEEDGTGSDRGAAYLFARNQGGGDIWGQVTKLTASDATDDDWFGRSVSISGDTAVIGAYGQDGAGSDRGAAYVFCVLPLEHTIYLPMVIKNN
jgi:hypothetical protein